MNINTSFNLVGKGFNAGIYLINCNNWREQNISEKCEYLHLAQLLFGHKSKRLYI